MDKYTQQLKEKDLEHIWHPYAQILLTNLSSIAQKMSYKHYMDTAYDAVSALHV